MLSKRIRNDVTGMYNYILGYCDAKKLSFEDLSSKNMLRFEF